MNKDSKISLLQNKTRYKLTQLRQEMCRKLTEECTAMFTTKGMRSLPALLVKEALGRQYMGKEMRLIKKNSGCKQKISLKVGNKNLSIGEYDSKEDGDLLEFVSSKCQGKKKE